MGGPWSAAVRARALAREVLPQAGDRRLSQRDWVELGRIGGPFGVRGWLRVQSFTDPPQGLLSYGTWSLRMVSGERREVALLEGHEQGRSLVAHLEGVQDRNAAAALAGASIGVARSALPALGRRQFYRVDLIGLAVRNEQGIALGAVSHFVETPAHAVMVVRGKRERWIPATPQHIRDVRLAEGWIQVDWPAEED